MYKVTLSAGQVLYVQQLFKKEMEALREAHIYWGGERMVSPRTRRSIREGVKARMMEIGRILWALRRREASHD